MRSFVKIRLAYTVGAYLFALFFLDYYGEECRKNSSR